MRDGESQVEQQFHEAMRAIYDAARQLTPPYNATRFIQMVNERGGKETADALLATNQPSDGFTELFMRGKRLDLSVEYLVLKTPYRRLFTPEQLAIARLRLERRDFELPAEDEA